MEDYKEKYEQAMLRMSKWVEGSEITDPKEVAEFVFPELKESEDERVRKSIIGFLKTLSSLKDGKTVSNKDFDSEALLEWAAWLEKQGEQKPVDKVEPKFKVGDWIINSEGMLRHILAVDKTGYQTDYGWLTHDIYDNTYHLWTIQDAKDGDVLCCENGWTCIFKNLDSNSFSSYCFMDCSKWFCELGGECHSLNKNLCGKIHPVTKEQRDLLFQKMKEAGYEWDAEKKELKKIERKPVVIIPKFHEGDVIKPKDGGHEPWKIMQVDISDKKYRFKDGYVIHFSQENDYELVEQKPTWSEEDESMLQNILECLKNGWSKLPTDILKYESWLESLKERCTWWKPSEEMLEALYKTVPDNVKEMSEDEMLLDKLYQGLKYGRVLSEN